MAVSQAQRLAKAKYQQEKRSIVAAEVSKAKGEEYRAAAKELNLSLAKLIQNGVEEYIQNHGGEVIQKPEAEKLTAEERRLLAAFAKLPKNAQINLIKTLEALSPKKEG